MDSCPRPSPPLRGRGRVNAEKLAFFHFPFPGLEDHPTFLLDKSSNFSTETLCQGPNCVPR